MLYEVITQASAEKDKGCAQNPDTESSSDGCGTGAMVAAGYSGILQLLRRPRKPQGAEGFPYSDQPCMAALV